MVIKFNLRVKRKACFFSPSSVSLRTNVHSECKGTSLYFALSMMAWEGFCLQGSRLFVVFFSNLLQRFEIKYSLRLWDPHVFAHYIAKLHCKGVVNIVKPFTKCAASAAHSSRSDRLAMFLVMASCFAHVHMLSCWQRDGTRSTEPQRRVNKA